MNQELTIVDEAPAPRQELATAPAANPMAMLAHAVANGTSIEQLDKLMALQERWEGNEARKAFNKAFAAFKSEAVTVLKGTQIKDGPLKGRFHANLHDVVVASTGALAKYGLSTAWKLTKDEPAWMEVTRSHRAGRRRGRWRSAGKAHRGRPLREETVHPGASLAGVLSERLGDGKGRRRCAG